MNAPYRTPFPTLRGMFDELAAAGRSPEAACTDLVNMIRDGAVTLLDDHNPPKDAEWLNRWALFILKGYQQMLRGHRPAGLGVMPLDYFESVHANRAQFEIAAGLAAEPEAVTPAKYARMSEDEELVDVAVQGLRSKPKRWPNKHQAAIALEQYAKGASPTSIVRRLEIKISKRLETTRNISKD